MTAGLGGRAICPSAATPTGRTRIEIATLSASKRVGAGSDGWVEGGAVGLVV
jgi:hypothetical protein